MVNGIIIIRGLQITITKWSKSHVLSVINIADFFLMVCLAKIFTPVNKQPSPVAGCLLYSTRSAAAAVICFQDSY